VVVSDGETERLPFTGTDPSPGVILADVAFWLDQRNVADCPRSMVDGSTVKLAITGRGGGGGGGGGASFLGCGGGGGAGPFFLQASAKINNEMLSSTAPIRRLLILNLPPEKPRLSPGALLSLLV
jgi:hypothetical protein